MDLMSNYILEVQFCQKDWCVPQAASRTTISWPVHQVPEGIEAYQPLSSSRKKMFESKSLTIDTPFHRLKEV